MLVKNKNHTKDVRTICISNSNEDAQMLNEEE